MPVEQLTKFEYAIVSLLEGKHTHALMRLHVDIRMCSQHIARIQQQGGPATAVTSAQERLLDAVKGARELAQLAWEEIADGYASYVSEYLGHPA
jgi:hypothetical protein